MLAACAETCAERVAGHEVRGESDERRMENGEWIMVAWWWHGGTGSLALAGTVRVEHGSTRVYIKYQLASFRLSIIPAAGRSQEE